MSPNDGDQACQALQWSRKALHCAPAMDCLVLHSCMLSVPCANRLGHVTLCHAHHACCMMLKCLQLLQTRCLSGITCVFGKDVEAAGVLPCHSETSKHTSVLAGHSRMAGTQAMCLFSASFLQEQLFGLHM